MNGEPNILDLHYGSGAFSISTFEDKVNIVAGEVLKILKDLSKNNKHQINSKLLAERMFNENTVKKIFDHDDAESAQDRDSDHLKKLMDNVFSQISELIPSAFSKDVDLLKELIKARPTTSDFINWIDSAVQVINKYVHSTTVRKKELENVLLETAKCLTEIDHQIASELKVQHNNLKEDIDYKANLSYEMNMIKQCFNMSSDIEYIKKAVFSKIENIKEGLDKKRKEDLAHLQNTEENLKKIRLRMNDVQLEAQKAKERSQELEFDSMHDTLTGVYNRKVYNQRIEEALAEFARHKTPSSLMVCDIDHFKKVNDSFGHKVGDLVLKKFAFLIKENLRKNDFIARYGGEEFVIILSHTHLKEALKIGEYLRSKVADATFLYNKDKEIHLTVSGGISIFKEGDNPNTVFERADEALYSAKRSGRNMIKTEEID